MLARAEAANLAGVLVLAAALAACAKAQPSAAAPNEPVLPDDIGAIEARLASNDHELRAVGIAPASATAGPEPAKAGGGEAGGSEAGDTSQTTDGPLPDEAPGAASEPERDTLDAKKKERRKEGARSRCERVCDLAASTCDLRARICDLAAEHGGDARYADACRRAAAQCDAADSACVRCR